MQRPLMNRAPQWRTPQLGMWLRSSLLPLRRLLLLCSALILASSPPDCTCKLRHCSPPSPQRDPSTEFAHARCAFNRPSSERIKANQSVLPSQPRHRGKLRTMEIPANKKSNKPPKQPESTFSRSNGQHLYPNRRHIRIQLSCRSLLNTLVRKNKQMCTN